MSEEDLRMERVKKFLALVQSGDDGLRQTLAELDSANWALEARAKAAEAKVARVRGLAEEWETAAVSERGACPDGLCGTCTQGNLASMLLIALRD